MILGLAIAVVRRIVVPGMRRTTRPMDVYVMTLVGIILVSGVFLEATKIVSYTSFQEMVEEWASLDEDELEHLKAYWAEDFGVVFPEPVAATDPDALEMGKEVHEVSCASCHSKPTWAFLSYGVSKAIGPIAVTLTDARTQVGLWYLHFLVCFVGLAYLPFSKLFHMLSSPVSLLANAVMDTGASARANVVTRRAMELDACTHCATCSIHCSVGVVFRQIANETILPSEKLISLKAMASGKPLDGKELRRIQEGSYICTSCYRCTSVCPVGINLQDLWLSMREDLLRQGYPENAAWARHVLADRFGGALRDKNASVTPAAGDLQKDMTVSLQAETFSSCFECQTCTNVCPVVGNYENPRETLGLLPHQIMHSLGLGLENEALGNQMIWDCLTCYMCQEHCPQGVQVTDVLYELKNRAYARLTDEEA
ncbi:MAG: 4Fe-4S dicluster domain-containing protein [Deltaproteobacteria bacterium]|nr:4Fe-4S dicluster domain-containing protein [Deltaproteobacteria bacterium]